MIKRFKEYTPFLFGTVTGYLLGSVIFKDPMTIKGYILTATSATIIYYILKGIDKLIKKNTKYN